MDEFRHPDLSLIGRLEPTSKFAKLYCKYRGHKWRFDDSTNDGTPGFVSCIRCGEAGVFLGHR